MGRKSQMPEWPVSSVSSSFLGEQSPSSGRVSPQAWPVSPSISTDASQTGLSAKWEPQSPEPPLGRPWMWCMRSQIRRQPWQKFSGREGRILLITQPWGAQPSNIYPSKQCGPKPPFQKSLQQADLEVGLLRYSSRYFWALQNDKKQRNNNDLH